MKYRIVQDPDNKYRIQYQENQFIFFGNPVWKYAQCLGEFPWESDRLEDADAQIARLTGEQSVIREV